MKAPRHTERVALLAAVLNITAAVALFAPASAIARYGGPASGPHPVPCALAPCAPQGTGVMGQSPLVSFTINPHVVHVGDTIHMQRVGYCDPAAGASCYASFSLGGPTGDGPTGVVPCPSDSNFPGNNHPTSSANMCLKAIAPTEGWQIAYVIGYPPGCDPTSSDCTSHAGITENYYIIDDSLFQLSGTVEKGPNQPVANLAVQVMGSGKHQVTRTDAMGNYVFALPAGTYRVRVLGANTRPPSRTVTLHANRTGVDFVVAVKPTIVVADPIGDLSVGGLVHIELSGFDPAGDPIDISLGPDHVASVPASTQFHAQFRLQPFGKLTAPQLGHNCAGPLDAVQGRDKATTTLELLPTARIVALSGHEDLDGLDIHLGDEFCNGEKAWNELEGGLRIGGAAIIARLAEGVNAISGTYNVAPMSRTEAESEIDSSVLLALDSAPRGHSFTIIARFAGVGNVILAGAHGDVQYGQGLVGAGPTDPAAVASAIADHQCLPAPPDVFGRNPQGNAFLLTWCYARLGAITFHDGLEGLGGNSVIAEGNLTFDRGLDVDPVLSAYGGSIRIHGSANIGGPCARTTLCSGSFSTGTPGHGALVSFGP